MKKNFLWVAIFSLVPAFISAPADAAWNNLSREYIQKVVSRYKLDQKQLIKLLEQFPNYPSSENGNMFRTENAVDLFEIIYDSWETDRWVQTDRYEMTEKLLPMEAELQEYEIILLFFVFSTIESGSEGDIGVSIAQYAPLLTLYDKILELLVAFEYILHQEKDGDLWVNDYRIICQKDPQGHVTGANFQGWNVTSWLDLLNVSLTYSGDHIDSVIIQAISQESVVLRNIIKLDLTYVSDVPAGMKFYKWDAGASTWQLFVQLTYNYSDGLLSENLIQYSPAADLIWFDIFKILYLYDENRRLAQQIYQSVDLSAITPQLNKALNGLELMNVYKYEYAYDSNNNTTDIKNYSWEENKWINDNWDHFEFDQDNHEILNVSYWGNDSEWTKSAQIVSTWADGFLNRKLYQDWTNEEWADDEQDLYTYHNNRLQTFINQYIIGATWTNFFKKSYNYDIDTQIQKTEYMPADIYTIKNYPNPFNPSTQIVYRLAKTQNVSIKIYNLQGQLVDTPVDNKLLNSGQHSSTWNGTDSNGKAVTSGIYIYEMRAADIRITGKCLLIK